LKSRWRILAKQFDSDTAFAVKCSVACAVLHNFCINNGDDWDDDDDDSGHDDDSDSDDDTMDDGDDIRQILKEYIATDHTLSP